MNLRTAEARPLFIALVAGALLPLAFAPFGLYPLALLSPAILFALWREVTPAQATWRGFLFGLGQFGVGVSWVYVAIHDFGHSSFIVAALLTLMFVALLAAIPALVGYLVTRLRRGRGVEEWRLALLWLPAWWTLGEWLRGWLFTGFPWLNLGYSMIDAPLAGYAPLLGVYGVTLAVALSAGALLWLWQEPRRGWRLALPLLLVLWGTGSLLGRIEWTTPVGEPIRVTLIQGNVPQITKWDPEQIRVRLQTYADLTRPHLGKSDLVIWPENAITVFYHDIADDYFAPLAEEARASNTDIILGVPELDADGQRYYTTMMSLGRHHAFYRKRHLVPFGEFVPLEGVLRGLVDFFDMPMSSFNPGSRQQPLLQAAGHKIAATVCYEDAFGEELIDFLPAATLLVNGSNNAWYGDSLAPHQHLQISRMRALETGRPMLRATTNGISAIINQDGDVVTKSRQFERMTLHSTVQAMQGATPYSIYGNILLLIILGGAVVSVVLSKGNLRTRCHGKCGNAK
ncbi:MAG: apolipoprotein N-acyltransferase [Gammaproteobacteria bacterium]|nr:apolipoprotein N-acyltransferase [Gammaproteobacteria bacterium]